MKIKLINFGFSIRPERKHYNDTGSDVYLQENVTIEPHETKVIPCGFGIELPDGLNAYFQTRTSIAKQGLFVQQCAIDAGYRGELHMIVQNLTDKRFEFKTGERLCYIVVHPCVYVNFTTSLGDERGSGAFGSTGK